MLKDLLSAANLLQLDYVRDACADFLKTQLDPSNCLGINKFADVHNCLELLNISKAYIKKQFVYDLQNLTLWFCQKIVYIFIIISREVVQFDEFLSLSSEDVIKLISCDDLFVPFEEKVSKQKLIIVIFQYCRSN